MKIRAGKIEIPAVAILLLAAMIFFLPALTERLGIFHNDIGLDIFTWQYFNARNFQRGIIPLWQPDTWCGAIPYYARYYADTYYFPLWPLQLLVGLDVDRAFRVLAIWPLLVHYFLAALGMYFFCRRGVRLRPPSALLAAWVYLFSPAFAYSYVWFPIVVIQAFLPWGLLLVTGMDRRGGLWRIPVLAILLALMFFAAQPPHLGYALALYCVLAVALGARRLSRPKKKAALRAPLRLSAAVVLSLLLAAVYWYSALDGAAHTEQHVDLTLEYITAFDGSLPPPMLATLFVPDLFGTVSGIRNWGAEISLEMRFWEAALNGGVLLTFLTLVGAALVLRRRGMARLRFWAVFGAAMWVVAVLFALGRHTPVYPIFFRLVPGISRFPYPIRYRLFQCLAAALLAGLGLESLGRGSSRLRPWPGRFVWGYLVLVFLTVALVLLWPQDLTHPGIGELTPTDSAWVFPGVREVLARGEGAWFLKGPIAYLLGSSALLVLAFRGLKGALRARVVAISTALSLFGFSFGAFYFGTFSHRYPREEHARATRPSRHPIVSRVLGPLDAVRERRGLRWATNQPFHDNIARLSEESDAFMGYDMKPLEIRFKEAVEKAYGRPVGWPLYWDRWRIEHKDFLGNMSVGYLLDTDPEELFPGGDTVEIEETPPLFIHVNPDPLPRAFTLDRLVKASGQDQLAELVGWSLRQAVFVGEDFAAAAALDYEEYLDKIEDETDADFGRRFDELQKKNPVSRLEMKNPNRVEVELSVSSPAMLVVTEVYFPGWSARVNGVEADLHRVNYVHRGVWLEEGDHRVEFEFRPRAWVIGARVSLLTWSALIVVSLAWLARRAFGRRVRNEADRIVRSISDGGRPR